MAKEQPTYEQLRRRVEQLENIVADLNGNEVAYGSAGLPESELVFKLVFENMPADANLWKLVRDEHGAIVVDPDFQTAV